MYNELNVMLRGTERKVFLQDGFYKSITSSVRLHKHKYADIHIIMGVESEFTVGGEVLHLPKNTLILIPRDVYHFCENTEDGGRHIAFQIEYEAEECKTYPIDALIAECLISEIEKQGVTGDHRKIALYLALIVSELDSDEPPSSPHASDYGFLIYEFFNQNYDKDASLSDLAKVLSLSERQAERLVLIHTGESFRDKLRSSRMAIAKQLLKEGKMSLNEISQYVGYRSYSGFFKAMKKHGMI